MWVEWYTLSLLMWSAELGLRSAAKEPVSLFLKGVNFQDSSFESSMLFMTKCSQSSVKVTTDFINLESDEKLIERHISESSPAGHVWCVDWLEDETVHVRREGLDVLLPAPLAFHFQRSCWLEVIILKNTLLLLPFGRNSESRKLPSQLCESLLFDHFLQAYLYWLKSLKNHWLSNTVKLVTNLLLLCVASVQTLLGRKLWYFTLLDGTWYYLLRFPLASGYTRLYTSAQLWKDPMNFPLSMVLFVESVCPCLPILQGQEWGQRLGDCQCHMGFSRD